MRGNEGEGKRRADLLFVFFWVQIVSALLGKGSEKFNYLHRFLGRSIFVASTLHVAPYRECSSSFWIETRASSPSSLSFFDRFFVFFLGGGGRSAQVRYRRRFHGSAGETGDFHGVFWLYREFSFSSLLSFRKAETRLVSF